MNMVGHYYNRPMEELFFWDRNPKGEIGIEVEVEGGPWPEDPPTNWVTHQDGSLRNGIEYVIRQPVAREKVRDSLSKLAAGLANSRLNFSYRTSIHVHVNIQSLTVRQWVSYVAAFIVLEEALVDIVGPKRAGNKFCLRVCDADQPVQMIRGGIRNGDLHAVLRGDIKYASMNVLASATHGTLEFRAMEGNLNVDWITAWADVLLAIKDYAIKVDSPVEVVSDMSRYGPQEWARNVLPAGNPITDKLLAREGLADVLYDGVRLAQDLAYAVPWDKDGFGAVSPVPNDAPAPFPVGEGLAPAMGQFGEPVRRRNMAFAEAVQARGEAPRWAIRGADFNNAIFEDLMRPAAPAAAPRPPRPRR